MESPYAAISLPDVARNGAQSSIGVSPVSVSGWGAEQLTGYCPKRNAVFCIVGCTVLKFFRDKVQADFPIAV